MSQYDLTFDLRIKMGHCDLYFMVQWFCLIFWRLFDIETIPWTNESTWPDAAPENKSGSLWFIFHGLVNLPYILKAIWRINMITWAYESVWFDAWPQNKNGSLWPIFHGSVILRSIFKTYWCINMIIMSQYDLMLYLKIKLWHCDLYFMVPWFCLISGRLFDV